MSSSSIILLCFLLLAGIYCKKKHFSNICGKNERIALISVYEPKISEIDYQEKIIQDPKFILGLAQNLKIMTSPLSSYLKHEGFWCVKHLLDKNGIEYSHLSLPSSKNLLQLFRSEEEELLLGEVKKLEDNKQSKFLIKKIKEKVYSIKSYPDGLFTLGWSYLDGVGFDKNTNNFSRQDHFLWEIKWL